MLIDYAELYGFRTDDMEAAAQKLNAVLGVELKPRDASDLGDCFWTQFEVRIGSSKKKDWVELTLCWNDTQREHGWVTPTFKEFPLVLMADHPGPPERLREPLSKMTDPEPVLITQVWYDEDVEEEGTLFLLEPSEG